MEEIYSDSVSIRAITLMQGNLGFAGSNNTFGIYNASEGSMVTQKMKLDSLSYKFGEQINNPLFIDTIKNGWDLFNTKELLEISPIALHLKYLFIIVFIFSRKNN